MKKSILEVYALAVCFFTVACFVVALGIGLYSLVQIANPEFTLDSEQYNRHQTNDAFWNSNPIFAPSLDGDGKQKARPPESELTKQRLESYELAIKAEKRNGSQSLVKTLIVVLIDIAVFYAHWRIAKRVRSEANA